MQETKIKNSNETRIIAEVGLAHEGSLGLAMTMAKASLEAGADIVKFQAHFPEFESSSLEGFRLHFAVQDVSRWSYWKRTAFSRAHWKILKDFVEESGGEFSVSVFSAYAVSLFRELETNVIKLGSGDLNNPELRECLSDFEGTVILSTGMASWSEIHEAANWLQESKCDSNSAILQCTSMYPTPYDKVGVNVMQEITIRTGVKSGLSDHSRGLSASLVAMTLGASYIEKHVTLSPYMFGPDISSSISLDELTFLHKFRGDLLALRQQVDKDEIMQDFNQMRDLFGRSLGLREDLPKGTVIQPNHFCLRKPSGGFRWEEREKFVGQKLVRDYNSQDIVRACHFLDSTEEELS